MTPKLFIGLSFCLLLIPPSAKGQSSEDNALRELKNRAVRIINSTMTALGERTQEFNSRMASMNEARPLEAKNLDSILVSNNISGALQFIEYLKSYQKFGDSLSRALEDSLEALKEETPTGAEEQAFDAFGESFLADHKAWNKYIGTLRDLYSEVLDALLYLQRTDHSMVHEQVQFKSAKDAAAYNKLMKPIEVTVKESKKAIEESKKATEWANQKIAEIGGGPPPAKKSKKKK
jgi:hypothetical protein